MPKTENHKNLFSQTLIWICDKLESLEISYMISGGSAVGFWGNIRTTMDIDIVVQLSDKYIPRLIKAISDEAYVDADTARKAVYDKGMFNIILNATSFKIDFIVYDEKDPYEKEKFARKVRVAFDGRHIFVISPEDLVISKLIWSRKGGGSERQLRDCESILNLNKGKIDTKYIGKWVEILDLKYEFEKLSS
jgi:hypothetical protein